LVTFKDLLSVVSCTVVLCASGTAASAQTFEAVGIRAEGMAGAFVAVADDASATWWNPAGLASGAFFSGIVERSAGSAPNDDATVGLSFVVPSLGVSYYRLRTSEITPGGRLPTFILNEVGATFGQSIGNHLVLASTVRLVRADQTRGDIDLGAMLRLGVVRVGLVVKHVLQPELTAEGQRLGSFDRQVRVGAAYVPHPRTVTVNAALDADLTTTPTAFGNARHLAGGAELWFDRLVGVRGGVSVNTVDDLRRAFSVGASAAIQRGLFVDAQLTRGDDAAKEGWGISLRVTF
jgi:hypothetical protein